MKATATLLAAILLIGGCDGDGDGARGGRRPTARPACPNEREVVAGESRGASLLEGDVDGDGAPDSVAIAVAEPGPPGCRAFVIADTRGEVLSAPIAERDIPFALGFPTLNRLAAIDDRPGGEIVVSVTAGASTQFAGLFTVAGGRLARVRGREGSLEYGDLFPFGGSVGHIEGSDCLSGAPGSVVITTALPAGRARYEVTRRFFVFEGIELAPRPRESETSTVRARELDEFPELHTGPFASCPAVPN